MTSGADREHRSVSSSACSSRAPKVAGSTSFPVALGGRQQLTDLLALQTHYRCAVEKPAIELFHIGLGDGGIAALVHRLPKLGQLVLEFRGVVARRAQPF